MRRRLTIGAILFAAAFAIRLAVVVQTRDFPTARHLVGDAAGYLAWASQIADGDWMGTKPFYQAPLYPYVLGVLFRITEPDVWNVRVMQAVWGAVAVLLLAYAGWRIFDGAVGVAAGAMLAFYGPAVFFDGIVQKASLSNLLVCALWSAIAWHSSRASVLSSLMAGIVLGLLCITRENALVWLPVVWIWLALPARRPSAPAVPEPRHSWRADATKAQPIAGRRARGMVHAVACLVGTSLILCPVAVRNRIVGGEWSLSTFQAGPNFYIGNHRGATGRYVPLIPGHETPQFEQADATRLAEQALERDLTAREVSRYWMWRAREEIASAPAEWAKLFGLKMLMVWNRYEVADAESIHEYAAASTVLRVLNLFHFGVLGPLAAVGIVSTWPMRRWLWIHYALLAGMAIAVAAFFVLARYRFPLVPILILFAAAGGVHLWRWLSGCPEAVSDYSGRRLKSRRHSERSEESPGLRGMAELEMLRCAQHDGVSKVGLDTTHGPGAQNCAVRSVQSTTDRDAHPQRSTISAAHGPGAQDRATRAPQSTIDSRQSTLRVWRSRLGSVTPIIAGAVVAVVVNWPMHDERRLNAMARMNIGVALAQAGELAEATEYFAAAVREHPGSAEAHNNLAQALALQNDFAKAVEHYQAALAIEPNLPGAWYNLGVALEQTGRPTEAKAAYARAVSQDPDDTLAQEAMRRLGVP